MHKFLIFFIIFLGGCSQFDSQYTVRRAFEDIGCAYIMDFRVSPDGNIIVYKKMKDIKSRQIEYGMVKNGDQQNPDFLKNIDTDYAFISNTELVFSEAKTGFVVLADCNTGECKTIFEKKSVLYTDSAYEGKIIFSSAEESFYFSTTDGLHAIDVKADYYTAGKNGIYYSKNGFLYRKGWSAAPEPLCGGMIPAASSDGKWVAFQGKILSKNGASFQLLVSDRDNTSVKTASTAEMTFSSRYIWDDRSELLIFAGRDKKMKGEAVYLFSVTDEKLRKALEIEKPTMFWSFDCIKDTVYFSNRNTVYYFHIH